MVVCVFGVKGIYLVRCLSEPKAFSVDVGVEY